MKVLIPLVGCLEFGQQLLAAGELSRHDIRLHGRMDSLKLQDMHCNPQFPLGKCLEKSCAEPGYILDYHKEINRESHSP